MVDLTSLSDERLDNLIRNAERLRRTADSLYREAVEERNRRRGGGLDLDVSVAFIRDAARKRRFVSYGELAEANGTDWNAVRYPMNAHLGGIVAYAHHNGWPVLSAIVVNKKNIQTGYMEESTLRGFIEAAKWLGHDVSEPEAFLRKEQEAVFAWAQA